MRTAGYSHSAALPLKTRRTAPATDSVQVEITPQGTVKVPSVEDKRSVESMYRGHRFPPEIIRHAPWLHRRLTISFRDVEDILAEHGVRDGLR